MEPSPELAAQLGVKLSSFTLIRRSQNSVFSYFERQGSSKILRLTQTSHRSRPEIEDELEWILALHQADFPVCPPVPQNHGEWILSLDDPADSGHAVVFERSSGRALAKEDLSKNLYHRHGKQLGALHAFARNSAGKFLNRRKSWDAERYFTSDIDLYLLDEFRKPIRKAWQNLHSDLLKNPPTPDNYGPAHLDLGYSNFFIQGHGLEVFDFDNCANGYYPFDIALALFGSLFNLLRCNFAGDRSVFEHPQSSKNLEQVWPSFHQGYLSKSDWPAEWNEQMPFWFEAAYFRAVIHAFRMQHPLTQPQARKLLEADVQNILRRKPPIHFDFITGKAKS